MGLASFGLAIGIFCDFLQSVSLLNASLGLDFLGLALSRPQVGARDGLCRGGAWRPAANVAGRHTRPAACIGLP
jgi:hypothetical protein